MAKIYIGTSGFSYSCWEKGVFYPSDLAKTEQLKYYSRLFRTVELNNPFYRLPAAKSFQDWYQQTPPNFIFALKASRYISHLKKLKDCRQPWRVFIKRASRLKEKLGPILFQFPANWPVNCQRLEDFLKILPGKYSYVFEFRHPGWFTQEIYQLFKKHNVALCLVDSPSVKHWVSNRFVRRPVFTADFVYLRLHGSQSLYSSDYTDKELKNWTVKIKKWAKTKRVYVYFNNDAGGYAVKNAQKIKEYLNA